MMLNTSYFGGSFRQQSSADGGVMHDNNRDETHPTNSTIADENSQVLKSNRESAESNIEVIKKCLDVMVTQT